MAMPVFLGDLLCLVCFHLGGFLCVDGVLVSF